MAAGTIVKVWQEREQVHAAVRVEEADGAVEYIGSVPASELAGLTNAQKKSALTAAVKAARDAQVARAVDVSGVTGAVTV